MSAQTTETYSKERERALRRARRRLRWLEIETHRIKAELARLEAAFEDDVADRLSAKWRRRLRPRRERLRFDSRHALSSAADRESSPTTPDLGELPPVSPLRGADGDRSEWRAESPPEVRPANDDFIRVEITESPAKHRRGRSTSAFMLSVAVHLLAICVLLPLTVATIAQQQPELLLIGPVEPESDPAVELADAEFAAADLDSDLSSAMAIENQDSDAAVDFLADVIPAVTSPAVDASAELFDALAPGVAETGTFLPAGALAGSGGRGQGSQGRGQGFSTFFGARSQGDRFVFIVDNSSSMKDGRLEAALVELARSVESLDRRQSFFVIFVADQLYPMYFPDRATELAFATPENKQRLGAWLGKVQLASGSNRELIKAMDLAAELRPHAVFLLWDGDLRYSDAVRRDVMNHLTRPQPWGFAIHTLGMGALSTESEQNLFAIARAHGGSFRRVEVPKKNER